MTSQTIPRVHHPGPRRGKVLGKEPKLGAPCGFQCQGKTQGETEARTSVLVEEGSLGPRVPEADPRGHHPAPRRGEVLCTRPRLSALSFFQCQAKTMKVTEVLTSVMVMSEEESCDHGQYTEMSKLEQCS
jgi:hypothetical protein